VIIVAGLLESPVICGKCLIGSFISGVLAEEILVVDLSLFPAGTIMDGADLRVGGCSLTALAEEFGTPVFVVDEAALRSRAREFVQEFKTRHARSRICFAVKSFPSVSIIKVLAQEGLGCDVVGAGELRIALAAGMNPALIVMHGNAKTDDDIRAAIDARIGYIVIDGFDDIRRLEKFATGRVPVLLRVSPAIEVTTHEALATGSAASKFGLPVDQVPGAISLIRSIPALDLQGLHAHIGSQIFNLEQFEAEVAVLAKLERFGVYDLGGGLGVRYVPGDDAPSVGEYARRLTGVLHKEIGPQADLLIEPGRSLVAPVGLTLYRVVTVKRTARTYVAVDGGMGDNLEHSLFGQNFTPLVVGRWNEEQVLADLVGRHCESGDVITPNVTLASPQVGDLIAVPVTGAYCFTMSNNYNAALRPPVVFCQEGIARLGVRRETYDDLVAREIS
jgi:diaminopimelate decarboxylase